MTRKILAEGELGRVDVLDLSDCQLDDECLIRSALVLVVLDYTGLQTGPGVRPRLRALPLRQLLHLVRLPLCTLTVVICRARYGIKKLAAVHRRTKRLSKLDMSRCQLSQNG